MQVSVTQTSHIGRYRGDYPSLASFFLHVAPQEADSEEIRVRAAGCLSATPDGFSLLLQEEQSGLSVSIYFSPGELRIMRGGREMRFSVGRHTSFATATPAGILQTEVYTEEIDWREKGQIRQLSLCYYACFSGVAQKTTMRFTVRPY